MTPIQPVHRRRKVPLFKAIQPQRIDWDLEDETPTLLRMVSNPPLPSLNLLIMMVISTLLIALSGLVVFPVPDLVGQMLGHDQTIQYSFQVPVALFLAGVFGMAIGILSLLLYLLLGLFVMPLFAAGGGLDYLLQPSMPYFVGIMVGMALSCFTAQKALVRRETSARSLLLLFSGILGVGVVHVVGTFGLVAYGMVGLLSWQELPHWWVQFTGAPILWDMACGMLLFCLIRLVRLALSLGLY